MEYTTRSGVCNICGGLIDPDAGDQFAHPECRMEGEVTPARFMPWRKASSVKVQKVKFLWNPRIALGKISLLAGDPGLGKSFFCASLAAYVSTGRCLPDHEGPVITGSVMMAAYEDGAEDTLRPRLDAQGADCDKVLFLDQWKDEEGRSRYFCAKDVPFLEQCLQGEPDVRLLVIDPLMSFVGGKIDTSKDNEVRASLQDLQGLAERCNIAVLCVVHLNKADQRSIIMKVAGSVAFAALTRSILFFGKDPETGRKAIDHVKNNLGPEADPLLLSIVDGVFRWGDVCREMTADKMLAQGQRKETSRDECKDWLNKFLGNGPRKSEELFEDAFNAGFSRSTVNRAKAEMGLISYHPNRPDGLKEKYWVWSLPVKK